MWPSTHGVENRQSQQSHQLYVKGLKYHLEVFLWGLHRGGCNREMAVVGPTEFRLCGENRRTHNLRGHQDYYNKNGRSCFDENKFATLYPENLISGR